LSNNAKSQLAETEKINKVRKRQTETNVIGNLPLFVNQTDEISIKRPSAASIGKSRRILSPKFQESPGSVETHASSAGYKIVIGKLMARKQSSPDSLFGQTEEQGQHS